MPLGPFQGKAFATSISPWIVTREALQPFCVPGPAQEPAPLPYLQQTQPQNYDLVLDVSLRAPSMNEPANICRTNFNQRGSLLEISWNGTEPVELASGVTRTFLEDGDSLVMRGWCQADGFRVGFGEVEGTIVAAG